MSLWQRIRKKRLMSSKALHPEESSLFSVRMHATGPDGMHISGAEGIYPESAVDEAVRCFTDRAMTHPRGTPTELNITVEVLKETPLNLRSLNVRTLESSNQVESEHAIRTLLERIGISRRAIATSFKVLQSSRAMRGAALVCSKGGCRLDKDRTRGVRASRLGISSRARATLIRKLTPYSIATDRVLEALMLATKVVAAPGVVAELCISDDPDYTTGYLATKALGYLRLPFIKPLGDFRGGRVIFLKKGADPLSTVSWLEQTPVIMKCTGKVNGPMPMRQIPVL